MGQNKFPHLALAVGKMGWHMQSALAPFTHAHDSNVPAGPGSGGGGGNVARIDAHLQLVDFYTILSSDKALNSKYSHLKASSISQPQSKTFEFTRSGEIADSSFKTAREIFHAWENVPFDTASFVIHGAMNKPLRWQYVESLTEIPLSYSGTFLPAVTDVRTAAYYQSLNSGYTVRILRKIWNELSPGHQIGLVIHEALRNLQIAHKGDFNDETLQKATAMMVMCKPSVKRSQYLFFLIMNQASWAQERYGSFEALNKDCGQ